METLNSTLENNKLIAEFMGWEIYVNEPPVLLFSRGENIKSIGQLNFNSDWNLLIEVVEKIENLGRYGFTIYKNSTNINGLPLPICNNKKDTKINAVFFTVIEFIKWHKTHEHIIYNF